MKTLTDFIYESYDSNMRNVKIAKGASFLAPIVAAICGTKGWGFGNRFLMGTVGAAGGAVASEALQARWEKRVEQILKPMQKSFEAAYVDIRKTLGHDEEKRLREQVAADCAYLSEDRDIDDVIQEVKSNFPAKYWDYTDPEFFFNNKKEGLIDVLQWTYKQFDRNQLFATDDSVKY